LKYWKDSSSEYYFTISISGVFAVLILFITSIGLSDFNIFTFNFLAILLKLLVINEGDPPPSIDFNNSVTSSVLSFNLLALLLSFNNSLFFNLHILD
tara:strand:+ start:185 stop:475 length:291 start_codon:yes stop_codon:yes gene_type:complete